MFDRVPLTALYRRPLHLVHWVFALAFALNSLLWLQLKPLQAEWINVPPVPAIETAAMLALGDTQLAYRVNGLMLQNIGDIGGRSTPLDQYDYERLGPWFMLQHQLDPVSNYMPYIAAYYYGATQRPEDVGPIVDYLELVGDSTEGIKWHWLAQAVHLARYNLNDLDRALELAHKLAALDRPDLPHWARQMPAFVMMEQGDREAAYEMLVLMLHSDHDQMSQAEVNFLISYICERIMEPEEAARLELCQEYE